MGQKIDRTHPTWTLILLPIAIALGVWLSPLAFVPVPWPDDSAFYFVAKDLFQWPPRWVMLPQAPFEPTYRIFNFNTMPLYPILIGLGRFVGIDGSFALKFWPLSAWALSGSLLGWALYRSGLPFLLSLLVMLGFMLDPATRWASVLVRPESFVGLCGLALVLGLTLGFPARLREKKLWDPVAALLAIAAYAHFNAIHLVFPVLIRFSSEPRRLFRIGWVTTFYLVPWLLTVAWHPKLFWQQMHTQWTRLAVTNDWLKTPAKAISGLFQSLGSPEPFTARIDWAAVGLWIILASAIIFGLFLPMIHKATSTHIPGKKTETSLNLMPASTWIVSSLWLWTTKPEAWFVYFIHLSIWCFAGLAMLAALREKNRIGLAPVTALASVSLFVTAICGYENLAQARKLAESPSWKWETYQEFVSCIDGQLSALEKKLENPKALRVWFPTFPDVTIELYRKHPNWELTRVNDFWQRTHLAIEHGYEVDAVVVTETLNSVERDISAPASNHPEIQSVWMNWRAYFLNRFWRDPLWKTNRYICQKGRWQAFLFMNE